ncbi:MAG TPA: hypothetical protein VNO51_25330 [Ilumatobacteraceae bacterium]|nr:hypothetical protein [Ilumatobacteraceae bacterium]
MTTGADREAIERWFVRRGVPHFIADYQATTNVWTRAFPALVVLFVVGIAAELGLESEFGAGVSALLVAGAIIGVLALLVGVNHVLGRGLFERPDHVGPVELILFVGVPVAVAIVVERSVTGALGTIAFGLAALVVVYVATSYGVVSISRFVLGRLGVQLRLLGSITSRAVPLLLLITVAVFLTSETWQMMSRLAGVSFVATLLVFVIAGGGFLLTRAPGDIAAIEQFDDWPSVRPFLTETPADAVVLPEHGDPSEPPLNRGQRTNMLVLALTTQAVQITVVSSVVWAFFVLLGLVAVHPDTVTAWVGSEPDVLFEFSLGASTFALTEQLLRVAAFLAAFSGLAFTVYLVTDQTYREEFRIDVADELRQIFAVRLAYIVLDADAEPEGAD